MKTDAQLKTDVMAELAWDSAVNATNIGVSVKDGVVTLGGHLETFAEKRAAERAARRVAGVRGLAVELDVRLSATHQRSDSEIAQAATSALRWHSLVPDDRVLVQVEDGWVTLSGELDAAYQLSNAEKCIRPLIGVRGLTNSISIKPRVVSGDIAAQISEALARHAARQAKHIDIAVDKDVVTLRGKVHSLPERDAAVGAAFSARGVSRVVDQLEVLA